MRKLPKKITGFRSRVINGLIEYLEASRIVSTPTIRMEERTNGTALHVKPGQDRLEPFPFRWYWTDKKKIKIEPGTVAAHYYDGSVSRALFRSQAVTTLTEITLPDSGVARTEYVYVEVRFDNAAGGIVAALVTNGGSVPNDSTTGGTDNMYMELYRFVTQGDGSTGANAIYEQSEIEGRGMMHVWPHMVTTTTP